MQSLRSLHQGEVEDEGDSDGTMQDDADGREKANNTSRFGGVFTCLGCGVLGEFGASGFRVKFRPACGRLCATCSALEGTLTQIPSLEEQHALASK